MKKNSIAKFKRYNFSLTRDVSEEIDKISLIPRDFRCSRSNVIKAGVQVLSTMKDNDIIELLQSIQSDH